MVDGYEVVGRLAITKSASNHNGGTRDPDATGWGRQLLVGKSGKRRCKVQSAECSRCRAETSLPDQDFQIMMPWQDDFCRAFSPRLGYGGQHLTLERPFWSGPAC